MKDDAAIELGVRECRSNAGARFCTIRLPHRTKDIGRFALTLIGLPLAAIQGLNQKVEVQRAELEQKKTEISKLKQRLEMLEQFVNQKFNEDVR